MARNMSKQEGHEEPRLLGELGRKAVDAADERDAKQSSEGTREA